MQLYKDKWASFEELPNFRVVYLCPPWESMCGIWWRAPVPHRREGYQPPRFAVSFQLITSILHSHTIIPFWGRGSFICKDCSSFRRNFSAYIPTCTTWQNFYLLVDTPFVLFELLIKRWKLENQNLEINTLCFTHPLKKGLDEKINTWLLTPVFVVIYQAEHNLWCPENVGWENFA